MKSANDDSGDARDGVEETGPKDAKRSTLRGVAQRVSEQMAVWRQRRFARTRSQQAVHQYRRLRMQRPQLQGHELYATFVCQRNAMDDQAARTVLRRAEQSYATWPEDRELTFRDVVNYLIVSEYLESHQHEAGTTVDMDRVIALAIPRSW